jgi:CRISPR/Cas system-associated exonuclease Cas4 (RecB family)
MTQKTKFRVGQRIVLPKNKEEGWPHQTGYIIYPEDQKIYPKMYAVEIDQQYRSDEHDDRIREVHEDDIQAFE